MANLFEGNLLSKARRLTVALSGGADSVALLYACCEIRKAHGFALDALHIHHGLSLHASTWATFCVETAIKWDVQCTIKHVTVERGSRDGLEAAARRARHAAFLAHDTDWILLAHHRDDQAETMLFNLLRGSGLAGASAMQLCKGKLLRPWLMVARADILAYAAAHQLSWIDDESNTDIRYSRNFLRHEVLPLMQSRFGGGAANLARASAHFAEARLLLNELAELDLQGAPATFPLSLARLRALSEERARNLVRYVLELSAIQIPGEARFREAIRQLREGRDDRHPRVDFGKVDLVRHKDQVAVLEKVGAARTASD